MYAVVVGTHLKGQVLQQLQDVMKAKQLHLLDISSCKCYFMITEDEIPYTKHLQW